LGIADVLGNVREWLAGGDPKNPNEIGGGFHSGRMRPGMFSFTNVESLQFNQVYDDLGFRVIFVPDN
jgi:hypothetical protein